MLDFSKLTCNEAQREAIIHDTGPMLVIAGPGSGKTFVITHRIQYLIQNLGISPNKILVITFTKAAACEMKERTEKIIGRDASGVAFGTFHSVFYKMLLHNHKYSSYKIIRDYDRKRLIKELLFEQEIMVSDLAELVNAIETDISMLKNCRYEIEEFSPDSMEKHDFCILYQEYEKRMQSMKMLDFDDLLQKTYLMFLEDAKELALWQKNFEYVLIDEFQDINPIQNDIIKMLVREHGNLFAVGDDDQSIYAFRGARPDIMLHFDKDYEGAGKLVLAVNYRCTERIVETAGILIRHNKNRFEKEIEAFHKEGEEVAYFIVEERNEEAERIIDYIQHQKKASEDLAILCRTNREMEFMAEKLTAQQIPFRMKEHFNDLYAHFIAQDMMNYLKFACGERTRALFYQFMNRPVRYIPRNLIRQGVVLLSELINEMKIRGYSIQPVKKLAEDIEWIRKMRPYAALHYILYGMGYDSFLKEYAKNRNIAYHSLIETAEEIIERSREYKTHEEWFQMIEDYRNQIREQNKKKENQKDETDEGAISIATMHGSKGLEYHTVIIPDCVEGVIPYKRAVAEMEIEEERRMFYVALTRAKKRLILFGVQKLRTKNVAPSRFIHEIWEENTKE